VKIPCGGPILANAKFTHEYINFGISLLILSQFQALGLGPSLKIHNLKK
jgi:hypothetical protein